MSVPGVHDTAYRREVHAKMIGISWQSVKRRVVCLGVSLIDLAQYRKEL
jgi:hypothetical protein